MPAARNSTPATGGIAPARVTGLVLAGGRGTRMGGVDKGLVILAGRPMVAHVLAALAPQVAAIVINANRNQAHYGALGWPVVADRLAGFPGPLAGFAAGLEASTTDYVVTAPCDAPRLPADLVQRLGRTLVAESAEVCVAHDGTRLQPVFALLSRGVLDSLSAYLAGGGAKIDRWYAQLRMAQCDFSDQPEAFANVNDPDERAALERQLTASTGTGK